MADNRKGLSLFAFVTDRKKLEWLGIIVVIALIALIGWPAFAKDSKVEVSAVGFDFRQEEKGLEEILGAIKGAGKVKVLITYETTSQKVPAYDSDSTKGDSNQTESQRPATDGSGTIVLTERRPQILGVVVVAEGASDMNVRLMLAQAVQTSLGIAAGKVDVFEMKH
jgi:stage III sporulation protein AG